MSSSDKEAQQEIPSPPGLPLVGNLFDIQDEVPVRGLERLIDICGPIAKYHTFNGKRTVLIGSVALMNEVSDETRFWKTPAKSLSSMRPGGGPRGLFASPSEDDMDWKQAHRTLIPAFGPLAIEDMFNEMHDICSQLVLKFARLGPSYRMPITSDFTRLTLDTIALCAMDFRFNSFYQREMHPFVEAMNESLTLASDSSKTSSVIRRSMPWDRTTARAKETFQYMLDVGKGLIEARRESGVKKHDLLDTMINGKDPKTGEAMRNELICANMVSFLVAGHETTSGLLSFALYLLLKHPQAYAKVQQEVDSVLGREQLTPDKLKDLHYIDAVLKETLRLHPTAPAFIRSIRASNKNDTEGLAGGKYRITRDDQLVCLIGKVQRDPAVYGEDANDFKPERMLKEKFDKLPEGAWKPFGTGVRACIGRAFAWQEALICLALLFQNLDFRMDDPLYQLKVKQSLTVKPEGFFARASVREGVNTTTLQRTLFSTSVADPEPAIEMQSQLNGLGEQKMTILYGSNMGTCLSLSQKLDGAARQRGYSPEMLPMDAALDRLTTLSDRPVVIITASYNGEAPDNASSFIEWLETQHSKTDFSQWQYAVFGCGHSDWKSTFQRIPTLVDDSLQAFGATRLADRGSGDAAKGSLLPTFIEWITQNLWPSLGFTAAISPTKSPRQSLDIELHLNDGSGLLDSKSSYATVVDSRRLTAPSHPEKWHLELKFPSDVSYNTGDYLAVLPQNSNAQVDSVMLHFGILKNTSMSIKQDADIAVPLLPANEFIAVETMLRHYVDLDADMTDEDFQSCLDACTDLCLQKRLQKSGLRGNRYSLIDFLCYNPAIELSFGEFFSRLSPLRPRFYSISSSALKDPTTCSLTYAVLTHGVDSSPSSNARLGLTGSYLRGLNKGDQVLVYVKNLNPQFKLPAKPESTPIILMAAGTGLAPFRAFLEERKLQIEAGRNLAPALMLVGCRSAFADRLYAEQIDAWVAQGVVDVKYAYSQEPEESEGCKYVQDRLWRERANVRRLWNDGAKVYICGSPIVASEIEKIGVEILREEKSLEGQHIDEEEAKTWFRKRRGERFVVDTFA